MRQELNFVKSEGTKAAPAKSWTTAPVKKPTAKRPLLQRLLGRPEPTTYHRCLAVHLHYASPRSGLS